MNWYKWNIGDYITHTLHLSDAEDLAYRRLIDLYMMSEKPIPLDMAVVAKKIRLDADVIEPVLQEFFQHSVDGWLNTRCEEEIEKYYKQTQHNQKIAKISAERRTARALENRANQGSQPGVDTVSTDGQHSVNQIRSRSRNRNRNRKNTLSAEPTAGSRFDDFWNTWPASKRKVGKVACRRKWDAQELDRLADQILAHVRAMKNSEQWREGFDPAPLTYLNQGRWEDPVDVSPDPFSVGRAA